uniref:DUF4218 domain-containing protein n=1 Tax=Trichogramma kaykai TaxID=54128 RepID=A0ABD2WAA5_9HYME
MQRAKLFKSRFKIKINNQSHSIVIEDVVRAVCGDTSDDEFENSGDSSLNNLNALENALFEENELEQADEVKEVGNAEFHNNLNQVDNNFFAQNDQIDNSFFAQNDQIDDSFFAQNNDWVNIDQADIRSEYDSGEEVDVSDYENIRSEKKMLNKKLFLNERIRKKTNTSNGEIILMCMLLAIRHSFTWAALLDVMDLINKLFDEDIIKMSKFKLMQFFPGRKDWYVYHLYCPNCKQYIGNRDELSTVVACVSCKVTQIDPKKCPYFLTLNIKSQIQELLNNPLIQPHLSYRETRCKKTEDNIEDVLDGDLYKRLSAPNNILHDKLNFSYIFNTDGCKASDSSPVSVWPVFLKINELPPAIRDNFIILVGLWVNEVKPTMNTFLPPLINVMNSLSSEGVEWNRNGKIVKSKIIPFGCCVDTPCRCSLLNMKQFNGNYGCTFCYHPSEQVDSVRKYPLNGKFYPLRSHENIIQDMLSTRIRDEQTGKVKIQEVTGVKGPSALMNLKYFDLADGMSPDSMHAVYLGVSKQITEIILSSSKEPYYVGSPNQLAAIDHRLLSIKTPKCITRTVRSVQKRSLWKASEWRSWLLYYCLPCLSGILSPKYFIIISKVVSGIEILQRDSIGYDDVKFANKLLVEFIIEFEKEFGKHNITYNVHLLLHIARSVQNMGPLQVQNAFCFENENRLLLHLKKSPTEIAVQISNRYFVYRSMPFFSTLFPIGTRVIEFTDNFETRIKNCARVDSAVVIGVGKPYTLNESEQKLFFNFNSSYLSYHKLIYKHRRYTTKAYAEKLKINDSFIELQSGCKGVITNIVVRDGFMEKDIYVFYHPIVILNSNSFDVSHIKHIQECTIESNSLLVCKPTNIKNSCILIEINKKQYISSIIQGTLGD